MALDIASGAWAARWKAVRPGAVYSHDFGLESWWRANADTAGYPLTNSEESYSYGGADYPGRVFSGAGVVLWMPSGPKVIGWP